MSSVRVMDNIELQRRVAYIKERARGNWASVLGACGVDPKIINKRNQPCPMCGGTDRYQFTDKDSEGGYYCRSCGPGDAFKLLQGVLGLTFMEALKRAENCVGSVPVPPVGAQAPSPERMKRLCQKIWQEAVPVSQGDEVDRYLRNRGICLDAFPKTLRFHPCLGFYEKKEGEQRSKKISEFPAMLACVQGSDGHAITLHRTYLRDGKKALGSQSKKVLSSGINGAAVRLDAASEELGVCEGIETGLAVRLRSSKPLWAALNAGNLEKLWVPDSVKRVNIYADNDANAEFAGQVSAFTLAQRLVKEARKKNLDRRVQVFVPQHDGSDWADVWLARLVNEKKAA